MSVGSQNMGTGMRWTKKARPQARTFGAGGPLDGTEEAIQPGSENTNQQIEESMTMQSFGGDRTIDENGAYMSMANQNLEFNFNQFKTQTINARDSVFGDYVQVSGEASSGDTVVRADPESEDLWGMTVNSLGLITDHIWADKNRNFGQFSDMEINDPNLTSNPFKGYNQIGMEDAMDHHTTYQTNIDKSYGGGVAYSPNGEAIHVDRNPLNYNEKSGLRRMNIRRSQSQTLARVAQADKVYESYEGYQQGEQSRMDKEFGEGFLSPEDRETKLATTRYNGSKYTSSQEGLKTLSSKSYKDYTKAIKNGSSKFSGTPLGA